MFAETLPTTAVSSGSNIRLSGVREGAQTCRQQDHLIGLILFPKDKENMLKKARNDFSRSYAGAWLLESG
jgi:hypothetical protein